MACTEFTLKDRTEKKALDLNVETEYNIQVPKGSTHLLCGPSSSGKTYRVAQLLQIKEEYIADGHSIQNIVFCYAAWQPIYDLLKEKNVVTKWVNYLPSNEQFIELVEDYKDSGGSIIVLDDFLTELNRDMVEIVCVTSRHYNAVTFILFQSLFPPNPLARQISLNVKYLYIHKNPRENAQISYLARQISPNSYKWIVDAYHEATKEPYSCFVIDMTQETPDGLRFRSNILPHEFPIIIYQKA